MVGKARSSNGAQELSEEQRRKHIDPSVWWAFHRATRAQVPQRRVAPRRNGSGEKPYGRPVFLSQEHIRRVADASAKAGAMIYLRSRVGCLGHQTSWRRH
jgi:hypothetical protein